MAKLNVAILAGGRSSEHDISRLSAMAIAEELDPERYNAYAILIERSGDWRLTTPRKLALAGAAAPSASTRALQADTVHATTASAQGVDGDSSSPTTRDADRSGAAARLPVRRTALERRPATVTNPSAALTGIDVIFPALHGPYGEDGTIQGLLETVGVPYVGAGVLPSALGMDKALCKAVLRDAGVDVARGIVAYKRRESIAEVRARVLAEIGLPAFVKPARLGSSIGISPADTEAALDAALELAFAHDDKVVVEELLSGVEVECGVLGNEDPLVSEVGQIKLADDAEWYDFASKYEAGRMELVVPAQISEEAHTRVQSAALAAFHAIDCDGLARIDCFVTKDNRVVVNEINTMPGFTATSAYARLFSATGVKYGEIVDRLIALAIDRHQSRGSLLH